MKIITDGDSFATRWKVEKAWPDYVREHYNVDLSNYSVAGSSNKQIVERLRENVLKESPDIILVMLTYQLRDYDIPDESEYKRVTGYKPWNPKQYVLDYFQHINEIIDMCHNVLIMQGVPHEGHTFPLMSLKPEKVLVEWEINKYICNATKHNFINFGSSIYHYLYENGMTIPETVKGHGHPTEEGHKYIARRFINELDKKNLF